MTYSIHITSKAERDIEETADYIEFQLFNPDAADLLLDKVDEEVNALAFMPEKYQLVSDPILAAWGIRMIPIHNYLAFYVIEEEAQTVHIVRFLYAKRNWISILRKESISFL